MPFRSQSQWRWAFAAANRGEIPKEMPHEWARKTETSFKDLPKRKNRLQRAYEARRKPA